MTSASSATASRSPELGQPRQAERVQPVAGQERQVRVLGPEHAPRAVVLQVSLADRFHEQGILLLAPARPRARGRRRAERAVGRSGARDRGGQQAAAGLHLRGERVERIGHAAISAKAAAAASSVRLTCSGVCASEGNQASNCDGGG